MKKEMKKAKAEKRLEKKKEYLVTYCKNNKERRNQQQRDRRRAAKDIVILTEVIEEAERQHVDEMDLVERRSFYNSMPLFIPQIFDPDLVYLAKSAEILKKNGEKNFIVMAIRNFYEERSKEDSVIGRKFKDAFDCHEFLKTWSSCGIKKWRIQFYIAKNAKIEAWQRGGGKMKITADGREKPWTEEDTRRIEFNAKVEVVRDVIADLKMQYEPYQIPFIVSKRKLSMKLGDEYSRSTVKRCLESIYGKKKWRKLGLVPMMSENAVQRRFAMAQRMLKEYPALLGRDWMNRTWISDESMVDLFARNIGQYGTYDGKQCRYSVKHGSRRMVWAAMSHDDSFEVVFDEGEKINQHVYLEKCIKPFVAYLESKGKLHDAIFQQVK